MRRGRLHANLPRWTADNGWMGGSMRTLYLFTDKRTGEQLVSPGRASTEYPHIPAGPACRVRVATQGEAEKYWQSPLHKGWTTA